MNTVTEKRRALYRLAGREPDMYRNHVILDICTGCGADCVYCLHQSAGLVQSKLMHPETFMTIADILEREGFELVYLYQSGESLLHPDYPDFLVAVARRGMTSNTATKLFMPIDFDRLGRALERCDDTGQRVEFLITVDALEQHVQDKIGPGIRTDKVIANLAEFAELDRRHTSLKCTLDTVVNAHNEHQLDAIAAFVRGLGYDNWFAKRMGYFMPALARDSDIADIEAAVPQSDEHPARFSIIAGELVPYEEQSKCDLGAPAVSPEGDLTVCCHDMLHINRLGNIIETGSLRKILDSSTYQSAARKGRCMSLDICKRCN